MILKCNILLFCYYSRTVKCGISDHLWHIHAYIEVSLILKIMTFINDQSFLSLEPLYNNVLL